MSLNVYASLCRGDFCTTKLNGAHGVTRPAYRYDSQRAIREFWISSPEPAQLYRRLFGKQTETWVGL